MEHAWPLSVCFGLRQLYTRRLDQFETVPIRGTENANAVFMSPDGRSLGLITADLALKRVSLADGLVTTVEHDGILAGAAWGADDRITFVRAGALWQCPLPAARRNSSPRSTAESGSSSTRGQASLRKAGSSCSLPLRAAAAVRRTSRPFRWDRPATCHRRIGHVPFYAPSGHLVFFRDGALLGAPFDVDRLEVTGPVVRVLENLAVGHDHGRAVGGAVQCWFAGTPRATRGPHARVGVSSRSGTADHRDRAAVSASPSGIGRPATVVAAAGDLWIQDIARATFTRLTSEQTVGNAFPYGRQMARVCCSGH